MVENVSSQYASRNELLYKGRLPAALPSELIDNTLTYFRAFDVEAAVTKFISYAFLKKQVLKFIV